MDMLISLIIPYYVHIENITLYPMNVYSCKLSIKANIKYMVERQECKAWC